ncbi:MAG: hypothetical protein ACJ76F_03425 [Bacteroidia bacterium]
MVMRSGSRQEFFRGLNKRGEEAKINKPADKQKIDDLQEALKSSRNAWKDQILKLKEAQKQIKYLQSEIKNLKADNENLKEDLRHLKAQLRAASKSQP